MSSVNLNKELVSQQMCGVLICVGGIALVSSGDSSVECTHTITIISDRIEQYSYPRSRRHVSLGFMVFSTHM